MIRLVAETERPDKNRSDPKTLVVFLTLIWLPAIMRLRESSNFFVTLRT